MNDDTLLDQTPDQGFDENKNYLEELVGENKKFKTPEDLARGKYLADEYIKTLIQQKDEMKSDYLRLKADYESRAKLEELLDQLAATKHDRDDTRNADDVQTEEPKFDPSQIENLIENKLTAHEMRRREVENFNFVKAKLEEKFGPNYQNSLKKQMEDLGIDEVTLNEDARKRPKMLLKALGVDDKPAESFTAPIPGSVRTTSKTAPKARTWSYYKELKKRDPNAWYDPKVQTQMFKDRMELGDAFDDAP
jgi:hypothetical protein